MELKQTNECIFYTARLVFVLCCYEYNIGMNFLQQTLFPKDIPYQQTMLFFIT